MQKKSEDRLVVFNTNRFVENGTSGNNYYGDCPFCEGQNKMYVNKDTYLWDCKKCGHKGNAEQYLEAMGRVYHEELLSNAEAKDVLTTGRKLPFAAFQIADFGWDGEFYTLLVRNEKGTVVDMRKFDPNHGFRAKSTKTCKSGLVGHHLMKDAKKILIAEGEWDYFATLWLVQRLRMKDVCVVGVGGAAIFKQEWIPSFDGKDVWLCYDNDLPGEEGEARTYRMLKGNAKALHCLHWLSSLPAKYDMRDWIVYGAVEKKKAVACWSCLQEQFKDYPRRKDEAADEISAEGDKEPSTEYGSCKPEEVFAVFKKWLHMEDDDALAMMFGTIFANRLDGDPLWVFLIAPPGGMKSELLMSLASSKKMYLCSSLTPHALVSGSNFGGEGDPSLMPKLNGKVLVLKDFTTTLTMHPTARDEIFGQLRDAYDGKFEKFFGNGVRRNYECRFGILAGCTPNLDAFASLHSGLGERFLKYRFERRLEDGDETSRIRRALSNINHETSMREELQAISKRFLSQKNPDELPKVDDGMLDKVIALSMLASRLRGVVHRDTYNPSMLHAKSCYEIGTRLGKQLMKLLYGVLMYRQVSKADDRCYRVIAKVAMDSVPDKVEEVVRTLYWMKVKDGKLTHFLTKEVVDAIPSLTRSTIQRTLEDLQMLGIVEETGSAGKKLWGVSKSTTELIKKSEVWKSALRKGG